MKRKPGNLMHLAFTGKEINRLAHKKKKLKKDMSDLTRKFEKVSARVERYKQEGNKEKLKKWAERKRSLTLSLGLSVFEYHGVESIMHRWKGLRQLLLRDGNYIIPDFMLMPEYALPEPEENTTGDLELLYKMRKSSFPRKFDPKTGNVSEEFKAWCRAASGLTNRLTDIQKLISDTDNLAQAWETPLLPAVG
jgi:hypothetical protein